MHCIIENFNANDNIFLNSNLILISSSLSNNNMYFNLRSIQLKFNKRQVNDQQLVNLIKINCYHLQIENIQIINSQNLRIFYLIEITHLFAQNIVFENQMINYKVPLNLYCTNYITSDNKLFLIYGYKIVNIKNIKVIQQFSVDQSLIEISSSRNISNNQQNILELIDLEFDGNLLLQQSQSNLFSLITINSEQNTHIQFKNIIFKKNVLHSQTDDSLESSTSLIYVKSITGIIDIDNLYCQNNALTNSSNSYIFLKSEIIKINNYSVSQHNILPLKLWKQFYDLQLAENDYIYDQEDINLIIQQTFNIKNKCGGGLITASEFYCFDCLFQDIIGERSSVFEIKTQGDGIIKLINLTIQFLDYDLSKTISSSGCITIYSSNSLLNLTIKQAIFLSIFNRMASSIFTIYPSSLNNNIHIQDVQITNCISLKNPIINLQFSLQSINFNKVIIENILISFQKENWIKYFEKTGMLNQFEMIDITRTSNALIYLENCQVIIRNIIIQGLFSCPLIKLINISKLFISQLFVEIEQFYSFNLLEVIQDLKIEQTIYFQYVHFQHIKTYENINNTIYHHPKINYIVQGCIQIEDKLQKPIIYSFDSIIKLMQQTQQEISIMQLIFNSNNTQFSFQNVIIKQNNCTYCQKGLIYLKIENSNKLQIRNLFCYNNYIQQFGCLNIMSTNYINQNIIIQDSNFFYNNGSSGVGISSFNLSIRINQCKILNNKASNQGGGLYLEVKQRNFYIKESIIINNQAFEGGGIYLYEDSIINNQNFIKSFLYFNKAERFADNLVEIPTHLTLFINSYQMQSEDININNITIRSLKLKPYKIIEQGIMKQSEYLMIPSNQIVNNYQILIPQLHLQKNIFDHISIALKNSRNELQLNVYAYTCQVSQTTVKENQIQNSKLNANLKSDIHNYNFDLGSLSFHQNPYDNELNHLQILVNCSQSNSKKELLYLIKARSYKCQLGEFYVDEGCQICQSINGFYSVTYNTTKCSIFDKNKFANITSNEIQLLEGYWRPHFYSDYIDACYNNMNNCQGGWKVGNDLCSIGYLGGLCEECDSNDIMGNGKFFKNKQDSQCYDCRYATNHILAIVFTSFWAIISIVITLKSIERSKQLFNSLWMKQRFNKTLFKLNQDLEGIFIKMLLNYLWIFSVIFTFNIKFSFSFSFIDQTSNTSNFLAFSIDCILQNFSQIELIYFRIMATLFLIFIQFVIILIGYSVYTIIFGTILDVSIISNTLLYLYVSNYQGLIKQFCSIISQRVISNIPYIQGDLRLLFGASNHYQWIYYFAIPGFVLFGFLIPSFLLLMLQLKKNQFYKISIRKHICYLINEYNEQSYFWEQIKLLKKTIIILIITYFEENILLKASLLGSCLLFYQLLAGKQQPYILQNLNKMDIQSGQICSLAIFTATAKYSSNQDISLISNLLSILILFLSIRLCYSFIFQILRGYIKKYKRKFIEMLYNIFHYLQEDSRVTNYLNNKIKRLKLKEERLKSNIFTLQTYIQTFSKEQINHQKLLIVNQLKSNNSQTRDLLQLNQKNEKDYIKNRNIL